MSGDDSNLFDEQLAALSRLVPGEGESRSAVEATRKAIEASRAARQRKRRFWMRMTIPSGIAAALIGAAVIMAVAPWSSKANAAEQLEQAVQATNAYKGWAHWTQVPNVKPGAAEFQGKPIPKRMTRHFNGDTKVIVEVADYDDDVAIVMSQLARREMTTYNKKSGTISISTIDEQQSKTMEKLIAPSTISDIVTQITEKLGRKPASVKVTPDGDLTRFDILLFATEKEGDDFRKTQDARDVIPNAFALWVNKDKLIARLHIDPVKSGANVPGQTDIEVTYGAPEIKEIYDLGVPRSAPVLNLRVGDLKNPDNPEMTGIMTRLLERQKKGFGDGVALLSSYYVDSTGQNIEKRSGNVALFITQGDKWLANQYVLFLPGNNVGRGVKPVLKEVPEGWPAPDIAKLLPALKSVPPQIYWVINGEKGWYGSLSDSGLSMKPATPELRELFAMQKLERQIWPDLSNYKYEMAMQNGMLRLRTKMVTTLRDGGPGDLERTILLDLAKDDLQVERYANTLKKEAGELADRSATHYTAFARLPNGQWYPTDWTTEQVQRDPANGNDNGYVQKFHLQVIPGMRVDEGWFADPRGYVAKE